MNSAVSLSLPHICKRTSIGSVTDAASYLTRWKLRAFCRSVMFKPRVQDISFSSTSSRPRDDITVSECEVCSVTLEPTDRDLGGATYAEKRDSKSSPSGMGEDVG